MALSLMLVCLVAAASAQAPWTINGPIAQRIGTDPAQLTDICQEICSKGKTMATYPGVCNMYLWCVESIKTIFIQPCPEGTLFSESKGTCLTPVDVPEEDACGGNTSPCSTGLKMPVQDGCMYQVCIDRQITTAKCNPGEGFDARNIKDCSPQATDVCPQYLYQELEADCQSIQNDDESYTKTVRRYIDSQGVEQNEPVSYTLQCSAGTYFPQGENNCTCLLRPVKDVECMDHQLVDLASARDTWAASHAGAEGLYKLDGNLTLENNGQAYISQSDLSVPALLGNDLGSRWNMSVTFELGYKLPNGNFQPGFDPLASNPQGLPFALVTNSVCDTPATFGCRLRRVTTLNQGFTVSCFANNHVVESQELSVGNPVTVTLSRQGSRGVMVVSQNGQPVERTFQFSEGEQVVINDCPLTIGHAVNEMDFTGLMDNVSLFKYACN